MKHAEELKSALSNLINLLQVIDGEIQGMSERDTSLNDYDRKLRTREGELDKRRESLDKEHEVLQQERDFVTKQKNEILEKEHKLGVREKEVIEAQSILTELEKKRDEMRTLEAKLAEQQKNADRIVKEKENIEHLRSLLERESVIDRERKKILNEEEAANIKEKERLQRLAEEINKV